MTEQTIPIQLRVGSQVAVFDDVNIDQEGGFMASTVFEDVVEQYVPQTGLLRFEDSDIGLAEFKELLEEHDSVQVVRE